MKAQTIITMTSAELNAKERQRMEELLNSPALLESSRERLKAVIEGLFEIENGETIELEIKKVE